MISKSLKLPKTQCKKKSKTSKNLNRTVLVQRPKRKIFSCERKRICKEIIQKEQESSRNFILHERVVQRVNSKLRMNRYMNGTFHSPERLQLKLLNCQR